MLLDPGVLMRLWGCVCVPPFQTRNPTHAGHAYLMRTAREKLIAKGKSHDQLG